MLRTYQGFKKTRTKNKNMTFTFNFKNVSIKHSTFNFRMFDFIKTFENGAGVAFKKT